jgi:hypothetical protein
MVFLVESDKWRTAKEVAGRAARRVKMWLLGLKAYERRRSEVQRAIKNQGEAKEAIRQVCLSTVMKNGLRWILL